MRHALTSGATVSAALRGAVIGAAIFNILSCSDSVTGPPEGNGVNSGLSASEARSAVASVTVTLADTVVEVGQNTQATATLLDAYGRVVNRQVTWTSSDPSIATVSDSGVVTGVRVGSAVITASRGNRSGSATVTVVAGPGGTGSPPPVASVTITPSTATLTIGQIAVLTATLRDASGAVLTGRAITWASANSGIATVDGTGTVTAIAAGTTMISATSEGVSGTATVTAVTATPPPTGSPEPGSGDAILWQDNFDGASPLSQYAKRGVMQMIPGRSGQAVRFAYSASSYDNLIERGFAETTDIYFRYWYRLSLGADPTCGDRGGSGMKWFMAWRPDPQPRYTMGVGDLDGGPVSAQPNLGNEFTSHDNSSTQMPNPFLSNINNAIRFSTTNDGRWHEYTLHIVTGNGGYEQIWVDGVLLLDDSAYHYDHSATGISLVQFPGTVVTWFGGCDFTIDVDDFVIWHH